MTKKFIYPFLTIVLSGLIVVGIILAWTEPLTAPPGGNVFTPLNVSSSTQYKAGALGIGGVFRAYTDAIFGGKVGIGTDSPEGVLDAGEIVYTYQREGRDYYSPHTPLCSCDTGSGNQCGLPQFNSKTDEGPTCYDRYAVAENGLYDKYNKIAGPVYFRQMNVENGKIKMGSQTTDSDSVDTVATKGYVDGKVGGSAPADFKWFTFGNAGRFLKEGAKASLIGVNLDGEVFNSEARISGGILQIRVYHAHAGYCDCDSGWVNGDYATCCCAGCWGANWNCRVRAKVFEGGIRMRADGGYNMGNKDDCNVYRVDKAWDSWSPWEYLSGW